MTTNDLRLKPPLDLSQVTQMVSWLDEEHRKDKKLISDLLKRIEDQNALIINHGRRIEDLDARLAAAQGQLPRLDQIEALQLQTRTAQGRRIEELGALIAAVQNGLLRFDQVDANMQQIRTEAVSLLPRFEHELHSALEQTGQSRALERERDMRAINELRMQLEPLPEIQRRLDAQSAEDRRLNEQFPPLHAEHEKLQAALEVIPPRLQYLEEWGERLTTHISDLKLIEGRVKGEHGQMLETIRRSEEDQRRQLTLWSGEIAEHRRQVDAAIAALPPLDDLRPLPPAAARGHRCDPGAARHAGAGRRRSARALARAARDAGRAAQAKTAGPRARAPGPGKQRAGQKVEELALACHRHGRARRPR